MKWESMYYGLGMAADYLDPENYQRNMGYTVSQDKTNSIAGKLLAPSLHSVAFFLGLLHQL